MNRFFTDAIQDGVARITGEDVRHITRVLRLRAGDRLELCDGAGTEYDGVIERILPEEVRCTVSGARPCPAEPRCRVTLFQALPKAGKLETIVQKCVELGVDTVVPVLAARCVAVPARDFAARLARLRRVAEEAAKQSHRGVIPRVEPVQSLSSLAFDGFDAALLAYEAERRTTLKAALRAQAPGALLRVALIVGPEGGFAPEEAALLRSRGAVAVSLGPRILRTETAGMAMLAQTLYELEQAEP